MPIYRPLEERRLRVKHVHLLQVILQVGPLVRSEDAERQTQQCPDVYRAVFRFVMMSQIVHLGMTVVAAGDAVIGAGLNDLIILELAVIPAGIGESRLQESAAAAATVVVRFVGCHLDDVFFTDDRFDHKPKIIGNLVPIPLPDDLTGVLDGELDLTLAVPFGTGLEAPFTDPLRVILVD